MYEVRIDISGRDLQYFCYWLEENTDEWNISVWFSFDYNRGGIRFPAPRTAPHRISSTNLESSIYKVRGLGTELYTVNAMMYNDIDAMAVKLAWQ